MRLGTGGLVPQVFRLHVVRDSYNTHSVTKPDRQTMNPIRNPEEEFEISGVSRVHPDDSDCSDDP